jgi:Spy/CpxP family protein refolding chaperone
MRHVLVTAALVLSAASALSSQQPTLIADGVPINKAAQQPVTDPFAAYFFPPELIMSHQRELGLQDSQRATIISELQQAQAKFLQLQWKMSTETERLEKLLQPAVVDEASVLEQVDRALAIEREVKRTQVALLIRIKNTLSAQQQGKLAELRKAPR